MFDIITAAAGPGSPLSIWQHIVSDFSNLGSTAELSAFLQVVLIDITLAGDNAIVVGALAAGLPAHQRRKVILIGIAAALVLRIFFALVTSYLLGIIGLVFAGGILLLWVAWKMYRELHPPRGLDTPDDPTDDDVHGMRPAKNFMGAAWAVALADVSMSLDNVLAVAGAAREHPGILMIGLLLAVALMGLAANVIAKYIDRYKWIAYVGLAVIVYVAIKMIYEGITDHQIGLLQLFI